MDVTIITSPQFIVLSILVALAAAAPRSVYEHQDHDIQQQFYKQQQQQQQKQQTHDYESHSRQQYQDQKHIPIVKFEAEQTKSGYKYGFEAANGIQVIEQGQVKNEGQKDEANVAEGYYSYKGDDGKEYSVQYVADENGFRAIGDHLPTPPSLPEENKKLIAEVYARPTSKYDEEEYEHEEGQQQKQVRYQDQNQQHRYQQQQHYQH